MSVLNNACSSLLQPHQHQRPPEVAGSPRLSPGAGQWGRKGWHQCSTSGCFVAVQRKLRDTAQMGELLFSSQVGGDSSPWKNLNLPTSLHPAPCLLAIHQGHTDEHIHPSADKRHRMSRVRVRLVTGSLSCSYVKAERCWPGGPPGDSSIPASPDPMWPESCGSHRSGPNWTLFILILFCKQFFRGSYQNPPLLTPMNSKHSPLTHAPWHVGRDAQQALWLGLKSPVKKSLRVLWSMNITEDFPMGIMPKSGSWDCLMSLSLCATPYAAGPHADPNTDRLGAEWAPSRHCARFSLLCQKYHYSRNILMRIWQDFNQCLFLF